MSLLIVFVFILGYTAIALEHPLRVDKAASALLTAAFCWTLLVIGKDSILNLPNQEEAYHFIEGKLLHHLSEISGILFFLMGAMTIVELVDVHGGFDIITGRIKTRKKGRLLWILSIITFFMSAALDNLTTSIIMATLIKKLIDDKKDLWMFAGVVVIAANAGGAWSPIGDVTTIMLWIGGQITAANIVVQLIIPSLVCMLVPLTFVASRMKGEISPPESLHLNEQAEKLPKWEKRLVFFTGVGALLFVPIFKTLTHLPPFMGILMGLGALWLLTELLHKGKEKKIKNEFSIVRVLQRIDMPSILFFLGILLAVSALQSAGHLLKLSGFLDRTIGNIWGINTLIGLLSSVVDNVPLVAGSMGMYSLAEFPADHTFWELLAYCAGTGGSALIIGSAAGVAIMGILNLEFIWYMKKISLWALLGYFAGIITFYLQHLFIGI